MALVIGELIGSYRVTAKLGEGGMGAVYLGEHQFIARRAAIKVLLPELSANKDIVQRFFNEARATSVMHHPGIVEVLDCAVLPTGNAYIVMELLEGESLGAVLRREHRLSGPRALQLTRHIAEALAAAHDKQIVHRDLKPDNVFVLAAPAAGSPIKILDFGIAKLMSPDASHGSNTRTGSLLGTPIYMSPEQCRGRGEIDQRTDIYSLGCILFEMLCGRPPFVDEGFGELIHSHLSIAPPSIRSIDHTLPIAVEALVARLLSKAPGDRPQTMRDVAAELDALAPYEPVPAVAGRTMVLPSSTLAMPVVTTTMRSASGEKVTVPETDERGVARPRRKGPIIIAAAVAVAIAGVGAWRLGAGPAVVAPLKPSVGPPAEPPPAVKPLAEKLPSENLPTETPPAEKAPIEKPRAQADTKPTPRTSKTIIKIAIVSDPPGADVCLAKDRILIGHTKLDWKVEKSSTAAKLLVRKRGYRGEEVTLKLQHDISKAVKLDKLGPDDIDDTDTCETR
jgi:eukaryotic-like serine/threonine-protein kinase